MQSFTRFFRDFHEGTVSEQDTRTRAANLLLDEEPSMIDEFMQLFESCCHTRAWAALPPLCNSNSSGEDVQIVSLTEGLQHAPLSPSLSGISHIGKAAESRDVGTVRGSRTKRSKSLKHSRKKRPEGKLEWQALAKKLVPEGRASYAIWFTLCNTGIILAVFAYMAGDYAAWVREHRLDFSTDASIPSRSDADAEVRP
jgi:hypothetical protein